MKIKVTPYQTRGLRLARIPAAIRELFRMLAKAAELEMLRSALHLPAAPPELAMAEQAFAEADARAKSAAQALRIAKNRVAFAGKPAATPDEIAATLRRSDDAAKARQEAQDTRARLRREYGATCREALASGLTELAADLAATTDHLHDRLTAAQNLHRAARSAGIGLSDPLPSASERALGILVLLRTVINQAESR